MSNFIYNCKDAVWFSIGTVVDNVDELYESLNIVWFSKTLQNHKALVMSTHKQFNHTYWEVTYNGDKDEYYVDEYIKKSNTVVLGENVNEAL